MLKLEKTTTHKWAIYGATAALALLATVDGAFAQIAATGGNLGASISTIQTQAGTLPQLVAGLAMPVGIFLLILGGLNLVKLGKDPNAEEMRNTIFKLLAGVFVLTLNWIVPYFQTTLGFTGTNDITAASTKINNAFGSTTTK